jgi:hypothetical protein
MSALPAAAAAAASSPRWTTLYATDKCDREMQDLQTAATCDPLLDVIVSGVDGFVCDLLMQRACMNGDQLSQVARLLGQFGVPSVSAPCFQVRLDVRRIGALADGRVRMSPAMASYLFAHQQRLHDQHSDEQLEQHVPVQRRAGELDQWLAQPNRIATLSAHDCLLPGIATSYPPEATIYINPSDRTISRRRPPSRRASLCGGLLCHASSANNVAAYASLIAQPTSPTCLSVHADRDPSGATLVVLPSHLLLDRFATLSRALAGTSWRVLVLGGSTLLGRQQLDLAQSRCKEDVFDARAVLLLSCLSDFAHSTLSSGSGSSSEKPSSRKRAHAYERSEEEEEEEEEESHADESLTSLLRRVVFRRLVIEEVHGVHQNRLARTILAHTAAQATWLVDRRPPRTWSELRRCLALLHFRINGHQVFLQDEEKRASSSPAKRARSTTMSMLPKTPIVEFFQRHGQCAPAGVNAPPPRATLYTIPPTLDEHLVQRFHPLFQLAAHTSLVARGPQHMLPLVEQFCFASADNILLQIANASSVPPPLIRMLESLLQVSFEHCRRAFFELCHVSRDEKEEEEEEEKEASDKVMVVKTKSAEKLAVEALGRVRERCSQLARVFEALRASVFYAPRITHLGTHGRRTKVDLSQLTMLSCGHVRLRAAPACLQHHIAGDDVDGHLSFSWSDEQQLAWKIRLPLALQTFLLERHQRDQDYDKAHLVAPSLSRETLVDACDRPTPALLMRQLQLPLGGLFDAVQDGDATEGAFAALVPAIGSKLAGALQLATRLCDQAPDNQVALVCWSPDDLTALVEANATLTPCHRYPLVAGATIHALAAFDSRKARILALVGGGAHDGLQLAAATHLVSIDPENACAPSASQRRTLTSLVTGRTSDKGAASIWHVCTRNTPEFARFQASLHFRDGQS